MEQIIQEINRTVTEKIDIMKFEQKNGDEELLKKEILNYLLDEESGFEV